MEGEHTISTQEGVGCSLLVLGAGWEVVLCVITQGGVRDELLPRSEVGGGCDSQHYWLMELLLDRTNYVNWLFD